MVTVKVEDIKTMMERIYVAVSGKSPILSLQAIQGKLMGQTSDGLCSASHVVAAKTDTDTFTVYVDYHVFSGVLNNYAKVGEETVSLAVDKSLIVTTGTGKVEIPIYDSKEYKAIQPPKDSPQLDVVCDGGWLKKMFSSSLKAVRIEDEGVKGTVFLRFLPEDFEAGGSDGTCSCLIRKGVYKKKPEKMEKWLDVGFSGTRIKALVGCLKDEDTMVRVFQACVALKAGNSVFIIPTAKKDLEWTTHDVMHSIACEIKKEGKSFEVKKKDLLSALDLISSNIPSGQKEGFSVLMTVKKDVLNVENGNKTAHFELPIMAEPGAEESPSNLYSIQIVKQIVSLIEKETASMTVVQYRDAPVILLEELTEELLIMGIRSK